MYDSFFYDHICDVYSISTSVINGAEKESKNIVYSQVPCALWNIDGSNLNPWKTWRKVDEATHKINMDWQYVSWVVIGSIFIIAGREYQIVDFVVYDDIDGSKDNISFYVRVR